jgi:hypothetical protein
LLLSRLFETIKVNACAVFVSSRLDKKQPRLAVRCSHRVICNAGRSLNQDMPWQSARAFRDVDFHQPRKIAKKDIIVFLFNGFIVT